MPNPNPIYIVLAVLPAAFWFLALLRRSKSHLILEDQRALLTALLFGLIVVLPTALTEETAAWLLGTKDLGTATWPEWFLFATIEEAAKFGAATFALRVTRQSHLVPMATAAALGFQTAETWAYTASEGFVQGLIRAPLIMHVAFALIWALPTASQQSPVTHRRTAALLLTAGAVHGAYNAATTSHPWLTLAVAYTITLVVAYKPLTMHPHPATPPATPE